VRIFGGLSFEGNATYEHDIYTKYTPVAACNGLLWETQCSASRTCWGNLGLYYKDSLFDAALFDSFTGRTFTSDLNNIELPSYHIVRLDAGFTRTFAGGDRARIGISVYNLFERTAVSEGSPRQGTLQNTGQATSSAGKVLRGASWLDCSFEF